MAIVRATKSGNWSDTTVWNTGALPTAADDVYSNTFTVTIDQDVTVLSIRNSSATGVTAGGTFNCSTARTIDCSAGTGFAVGGAGTTLLTLSHTAGTTVTTRGTVAFGGGVCFVLSSTGTTNHTGTINGTSPGISVSITGAHTFNVTGNLPATNNGNCIICGTGANATISIVGNLTSGAGNATTCMTLTAGSSATVTGSVSSNTTQEGGIIRTIAGATLSVTGVISTTTTGLAIQITNGSLVATGPFICSSVGNMPFGGSLGGTIKIAPIANSEFRFALPTGVGTTSLYSADVVGGNPSASDVRFGTVYGVGGTVTGTCRVPAASLVGSGVPVDNTTGTASLSPADVAALVGAQIAAALDSTP
jgi:hypothetical protein